MYKLDMNFTASENVGAPWMWNKFPRFPRRAADLLKTSQGGSGGELGNC